MRAGPLLCSLLLSALCPVLAPAQTLVQTPAPEARRVEVERLLDALPAAPDETAGRALEARIRGLWAQQASPTVALLMRRGQRNLETEAAGDAVEDFDAALVLQPTYAEAWLMRAQALLVLGDLAAATQDLRQALVLQPRHFGALTLLSMVREQAGDREGALRAMQEAVSLHPWIGGGAERLRALRRRALGEDA